MIDEALAPLLVEAGRQYLLWELVAQRDAGSVDFAQSVIELGVEDASLEEQVDAYVEAVGAHWRAQEEEAVDEWLEWAEREYGPLADEYIARYGDSPRQN